MSSSGRYKTFTSSVVSCPVAAAPIPPRIFFSVELMAAFIFTTNQFPVPKLAQRCFMWCSGQSLVGTIVGDVAASAHMVKRQQRALTSPGSLTRLPFRPFLAMGTDLRRSAEPAPGGRLFGIDANEVMGNIHGKDSLLQENRPLGLDLWILAVISGDGVTYRLCQRHSRTPYAFLCLSVTGGPSRPGI